jgi:hypothetical protein
LYDELLYERFAIEDECPNCGAKGDEECHNTEWPVRFVERHKERRPLPMERVVSLSDKELRGLMKRSVSRRFSDFMYGVRLAFTGKHPNSDLCAYAIAVSFVGVLMVLIPAVNQLVAFLHRVGGR